MRIASMLGGFALCTARSAEFSGKHAPVQLVYPYPAPLQ